MKEKEAYTKTLIKTLFKQQKLAVLATHHNGQPYTSLVGFWASSDYNHIFFATPRTTRKYAYLRADKRVALLINNSCNQLSDFYEAIAVTAIGEATEAVESLRTSIMPRYLDKHPQLTDFIRSDSTAFICVMVKKYLIVHNFQNVWELEIRS
jgi:general stress protein 26